MKNCIVLLLLFSILSINAWGSNNKLSANTQIMISELNNKNMLLKSDSKSCINEIGAYIILEKGTNPYIIEEFGAKVNMVLDTIISARIPLDAIYNIAALDEVKAIDSGRRAKLKLDKAREAIMYDNIVNSLELPGAYTGKDVVVGFIDCGMQYDHIGFYDKNGNLRIKRVWNQPINTGTPPDGYSYGSEYKTEEEIIAAKYDDTTETHATHVAGIATGSYKDNNFYGIAPECDIVYVGYNYNDESLDWTSITDAIAYIYDYADSVNKPCVVNISLGDVYGPHDGCSIFDQVCDILQGEGKLLVGSAGNEGSNRQHIKKEFTAAQDSLRTFVSLLTKYGTYYASQCDFYGEIGKEFSVKVCVVKTSNGVVVNETESISSSQIGTHTLSLSKVDNIGANASIQVICEIEPGSKRPHIDILSWVSSIKAGYSIGFKITGDVGSTIHGWADDYYSRFTNKSSLEGWTPGDLESNIAEIGGTGKRIISVGSYMTKSFTGYTVTGEISSFSSKGPTIDGRMKPDITAPGEYLVSSLSNSATAISNNTTAVQRGDTITIDGTNYYYGALKGTSMSSPVVAGTLALWLEANPNLTPEDVREVLAETAIRDSETGSEPNNTWGYGKLDAWSGLKMVLEMNDIEVSEIDDNDNSVRVYVNSGEINVLFAKSINNCNIAVYDITGKILTNNFVGYANAGDEICLDKILNKGVYIIKIDGDNFRTAAKVIL